MKKLYRFAVLPSVLAVTLAAGITIHGLLFKPRVWLSTSSPDKTYTVELTGDKGRGGFIFPNTVRFDVIRDGQMIVKDARAHSGDFMDISFELAYPENAWVSENTLRFWRNPHRPEEKGKFDTLLISNVTDKPIRYLKIKSKDMFLAFDVRPHSTLQLSSTPQPGDGFVWVEGEFEDGRRIDYFSNFPDSYKVKEPLRYCVSVSPGSVTIRSPQVEGYDDKGNWDRLNIPKSLNCNP